MADAPKLDATDQRILGDFCALAARLAENGVYMNQMYSVSLNAPVLVICAIGEQALALQSIVMRNAVPESQLVQHVTENHPKF